MTALAVERALMAVVQDVLVKQCRTLTELRAVTSQAALSDELRTAMTVLCVIHPGECLTAERAFSMHCRLRQRVRIGRKEVAWSGGLIFLGGSQRDCQELDNTSPFNLMTGHAALPFTSRLIDILLAVWNVKVLRLHRWKHLLTSLGLAAFWDALDIAQRSLAVGECDDSGRRIIEAVQSLLKSDRLDRLFAHRSVRIELAQAISISNTREFDGDTAKQLIHTVRRIMSEYRLA